MVQIGDFKFADLLFTRYASPFILLDGYISCGRFSEFVDNFSEAEAEKMMWEYFLHKIHDRSWDDFKGQFDEKKPPEKEQIETTIKNSKDMMSKFIP